MKKIALILFGAAALMAFISCGSKPEPEPETKPSAPETVVEEKVNEDIPDTSADDEAAKKAAEDAAAAEKAAAEKAAKEAAQEAYQNALEAKLEIEENELAEYDQKNYDAGCAIFAELEAMMKDDSVSGAELEAKAKEAYSKFRSVLSYAYKQLAKEWRDEAYLSKRNADTVKAAVSEKERYQKAVKDFKEGDTLYAMQAAEKAIDKYISADEEFESLYEELTEKRAVAFAAIEAAKKAVAEVEKLAVEADITDPVTEETEGIEDEETVLLEETTYADPEEAIEDIPEDMDGEEPEESIESDENL